MSRYNLERFFNPRSVAIVGLSDKMRIPSINNLINHPELDCFLIHPKKQFLYDRPVCTSLQALGKPVDAVLSLVSAANTGEIVRQAVTVQAGGVVIVAAGFKEAGAAGKEYERDVEQAAQGILPCLGPNCFGFANLRDGIDLSLASAAPARARPGSIGIITHTGGMIPALVTAGLERNIGFSYAISTGNEANLDMVDCLEYLIDNPATRVICLIVESIRRPDAFFAAASKALALGKPIVALKLGRSALAVELTKSHTGALAGDAWVYDAAFRQFGIATAHDLSELLDKLSCFEQLPNSLWPKTRDIAVISPSGGGASLACDVLSDFKLHLPPMESIREQMQEVIPVVAVLNPLDTTGFIFSNPTIGETIAQLYASSPDAGTLLFQWHLQDQLVNFASPFIEALLNYAQANGKVFILSAADDARIEDAALQLAERGAILLRGPRAAGRALQAVAEFLDASSRFSSASRLVASDRLPAPATPLVIDTSVGQMLTFAATMELLAGAGLEVAPYCVVQPLQATPTLPAGSKFVVKLADVPHRTDIDAIRFNVVAENIDSAIDDLRSLAKSLELPEAVAIQAQMPVEGEVFIGISGDNELGTTIVCGLGGIFVELFKRFCGLIVPFSHGDALHALGLLEDTGVFDGLRGKTAWDRNSLASAMVAAGRLAQAGQSWISSFDINPMVISNQKMIAVDGLCIVRPDVTAD